MIEGCFDPNACTFSPEATSFSANLCEYAEENYDCEGNCIIGEDCAGVCGGSAEPDECGTCDADSSNDCVQDCAGTWGGTAYEDECGVCDDNPANDNINNLGCGCFQPAPEIWYIDNDGDGLGSGEGQEFCLDPGSGWAHNNLDDDDTCSGTIDECGVCGGDGSTCSEIILSLIFDDNVATVNYTRNYPIAGFQFTIQGTSILNLIDGGDSESNGLTLSIGEYIVIGFSVAANTIPAGEGSLLSFSATENPITIYSPILNVNPLDSESPPSIRFKIDVP
jgi:hypothetical protein